MADYVPPLSPDITFRFVGNEYTPPLSGSIQLIFGADEDGEVDTGLLRGNYMILLTM